MKKQKKPSPSGMDIDIAKFNAEMKSQRKQVTAFARERAAEEATRYFGQFIESANLVDLLLMANVLVAHDSSSIGPDSGESVLPDAFSEQLGVDEFLSLPPADLEIVRQVADLIGKPAGKKAFRNMVDANLKLDERIAAAA